MKNLLFALMLLPTFLWGDCDTIYPCDDSWVVMYAPDNNHGSEQNLCVQSADDEFDKEIYLGIPLPVANISSCSLFCYCWDMVVNQNEVVDSTGRFDEGTITWNNKPAKGVHLDTVYVNATGWWEWDITQVAQSQENDTVWLNMHTYTQSNNTTWFRSKEYTGITNDPYIKVYYTPASAGQVIIINTGQ